jgi:hypothetical protein
MQLWSWGLKALGTAAMVAGMLYFGLFMGGRGWVPGSSGSRNPMMTAISQAEGLEWFAPAPPGSLLSGYLAMAGQFSTADGTHR